MSDLICNLFSGGGPTAERQEGGHLDVQGRACLLGQEFDGGNNMRGGVISSNDTNYSNNYLRHFAKQVS